MGSLFGGGGDGGAAEARAAQQAAQDRLRAEQLRKEQAEAKKIAKERDLLMSEQSAAYSGRRGIRSLLSGGFEGYRTTLG